MIAFVLWWIITVYVWVLLARVVLSFVPLLVPGWTPRGLALLVVEGVYTVTDPPINGLRRIIPPMRLGNVALDLSVLVLLLGLQLLQSMLALLPV
ncbi:YggT family protein [Tessaracoccus oleiagri]|uniref:YggT family protein n=1 Tax=Tessaracoccus oleiagri TaxID=686624 RepID=A0A1G9L3L0_9ACTN|nr:YggT family protein [Tessaracoccus oleiagri]SDL56195.1 YggT family protein [Tessaracoccus oleiagri]